MSLGVVYCALCESFPGRCKIGKTFRNAPKRIGELQRHYKSRHVFTEHASMLVEYYGKVEWLAHRRLAHCREPATEMFRCTPEEAMAVIRWAADEALRNPTQYQPRFQPRPQRATKRWRRARHGLFPGLVLLALTAAMLCGLIQMKPDMTLGMPEFIQRTAFRIEAWL